MKKFSSWVMWHFKPSFLFTPIGTLYSVTRKNNLNIISINIYIFGIRIAKLQKPK